VTFRGQTIAEVAALPIDSLHAFFDSSGVRLDSGSEGVLPLIRREVIERCEVLQHLGLGYLTLDRESATLSSGEA
jgi:excinuclease ABC subunit A